MIFAHYSIPELVIHLSNFLLSFGLVCISPLLWICAVLVVLIPASTKYVLCTCFNAALVQCDFVHRILIFHFSCMSSCWTVSTIMVTWFHPQWTRFICKTRIWGYVLFQTGYLEKNKFFCLHKTLRKAEQMNKEPLQSTDKKFFWCLYILCKDQI